MHVKEKRIEHCCKDMRLSLYEPREPMKYGSVFREYYIEGDKGLKAIYCLWCGTKLPESLRDKFFDTLEQEYEIKTDIGECWERPNLPPEFRTDEWWKKRGL